MSRTPREVLIERIIAFCIARHIDSAIAGHDPITALSPQPNWWKDTMNELVWERRVEKWRIHNRSIGKPIAALVRTSKYVRQVTIQALAVLLHCGVGEKNGVYQLLAYPSDILYDVQLQYYRTSPAIPWCRDPLSIPNNHEESRSSGPLLPRIYAEIGAIQHALTNAHETHPARFNMDGHSALLKEFVNTYLVRHPYEPTSVLWGHVVASAEDALRAVQISSAFTLCLQTYQPSSGDIDLDPTQATALCPEAYQLIRRIVLELAVDEAERFVSSARVRAAAHLSHTQNAHVESVEEKLAAWKDELWEMEWARKQNCLSTIWRSRLQILAFMTEATRNLTYFTAHIKGAGGMLAPHDERPKYGNWDRHGHRQAMRPGTDAYRNLPARSSTCDDVTIRVANSLAEILYPLTATRVRPSEKGLGGWRAGELYDAFVEFTKQWRGILKTEGLQPARSVAALGFARRRQS